MAAIDLNSGATAPVTDEVDLTDLPITGTIPLDLDGVLVRNGPNRWAAASKEATY
jgi:carotenoid cleavage dioxygenase-like enzyme